MGSISSYIIGIIYILYHNLHIYNYIYICFWNGYNFIMVQYKEFINYKFYITDSTLGSLFYTLSGLHALHVIIGLIILGILNSVSIPFVHGNVLYTFLLSSTSLYFILQVLYWHFVEIV